MNTSLVQYLLVLALDFEVLINIKFQVERTLTMEVEYGDLSLLHNFA